MQLDFEPILDYNWTKKWRKVRTIMNDLIYLDTYVVQQDMRIRLPKSVLSNLDINKGQTKLDIYLDLAEKSLVLKPNNDDRGEQ